MYQLIRPLIALCSALLVSACSASSVSSIATRIPGPVGDVASAAAVVTGVKATSDAWQFVTDRRPVPMRGTYRVTQTVGADKTTYFLRTAPMSGIPIMGPGKMGQQGIQGYVVMAIAGSTIEALDNYQSLKSYGDDKQIEAEAKRRGMGAGALWVKGSTDKEMTAGSWEAIVSISFPEGANAFYDRHRQTLTQYELGQSQGGEDMFVNMEAGEIVVAEDGAHFTQTIRDPQGGVLFTIAGERISMESLDYGDEKDERP